MSVGLCLLLAACWGGGSAPVQLRPPTGTLSGHLFAVGGLAPGFRPLNGTVTIVQGPDRSSTVSVGTDGRFSIAVPPGRYLLEGRSPLYDGGKGTCRADRPATVRAGATVVANVYCQEM